MAVLTFGQVTMCARAGVVEILKDLSFAVEPGDFIALVGPSGAGKTSLLRLMNRLAEASSGTIRFEGEDIKQIPSVSLRRQIALVNQESRLLGMSVEAALGYPLRLQGRPPAEITAAVAHWTAQMNIPSDWLSRTAVNLSLGQRQRVAITRSLINNPKILLLDEPTSSQDVGYSEFLLGRLAEWTSQGKLTVIMANHQVDLAARYVNRLWHLENGKLIADSPATAVDWPKIHQSLIAAEQKSAAEWA